MAEQWTEKYTIDTKDITKTYSTHGITFRVDRTDGDGRSCWVGSLVVNGENIGSLRPGESTTVDEVTFYLEDAPLPFGTPVILIVSGETEVFDMAKALLLAAVLIGLYIYYRR